MLQIKSVIFFIALLAVLASANETTTLYRGTIKNTPRTKTTRRRLETFTPPPSDIVQSMYLKELVDDLPPLETIHNCDCPRVYIPICGTDNKSYTNVCKMNCINRRRKRSQRSRVAYIGICQQYIEPFEY